MLTNARRLCVARRGSAAAAQPLWLPSERRSFLDGFFRRCTARCLESCHRLRVMPPARLLHPRRATYTVADRHQIFDPDNRSVSCALDPNDPIRAIMNRPPKRPRATTSPFHTSYFILHTSYFILHTSYFVSHIYQSHDSKKTKTKTPCVAQESPGAVTRVRRQARRITVTLRLGTGHRRPRPPMIRLAPQPCVAPWNLPPLTKNVRWRSAAFGDVPRATTAARDVPPPTAATRSDGFLSRESDCQFSRTGQLRGERRRSWPRGRAIPGSRGTTQGEQTRRGRTTARRRAHASTPRTAAATTRCGSCRASASTCAA
jgi:hypothetical protein